VAAVRGSSDRASVAPTGETTVLRSRRELLKVAIAGSGTVLLGGVAVERMLGATASTPSAKQDQQILNYALLLEYLQAAFYTEALSGARLRGELREFADVVGGHEQAHVAFLKKALGANARQKPTFHFGAATRNPQKFGATAQALEDAGVAAYNGQAANLTKPTLAAAIKIVSVEGRHAAWIRDILGVAPAPFAADAGATPNEITAKLRSLGVLG
jgi:ferritin-like protein